MEHRVDGICCIPNTPKSKVGKRLLLPFLQKQKASNLSGSKWQAQKLGKVSGDQCIE